MKKNIIIFVFLVLLAAGAFAEGFSLGAGGGGMFDWSLYNGAYTEMEKTTTEKIQYYKGEWVLAPGAFAFFDATYAELGVGFTYGFRMSEDTLKGDRSYEADGSFMALNFSLLGKFPFHLGRVTLFPLLGGDFNLVLVDKDRDDKSISDYNEEYKPFDWSQIGALTGLGLDINLTGSFFLKMEALFHFRFRFLEKGISETTDRYFLDHGLPEGTITFGSMGPQIKIGLGYRFFEKPGKS